MADSGVTVPRNDRAVPSTRYRTGYDAVAADYAEWVNNDFATKPLDRALLAAFAELVHANGAGPPLHLTREAAPRTAEVVAGLVGGVAVGVGPGWWGCVDRCLGVGHGDSCGGCERHP
jgi:hypothetical protein